MFYANNLFLNIFQQSFFKKVLPFTLTIFVYCNLVNAEENKPYWILDYYYENDDDIETPLRNNFNLSSYKLDLKGNTLYVNNVPFEADIKGSEKLSVLVDTTLVQTQKEFIESFVDENGKIQYLEFKKNQEIPISDYLLNKNKVLYSKDTLIFVGGGYLLTYVKPYGNDHFQKLVHNFPQLTLPINSKALYYSGNDIFAHLAPKTNSVPENFVQFLSLDEFNWGHEPSYFHGFSAALLPDFKDSPHLILLRGITMIGEEYFKIYTFSDDYHVLDKLPLYDYHSTTRGGPGSGGYSTGYVNFNIDNNYFIDRWRRFDDETLEIKHYQVTEQGRFKELPVTSSCYSEFAPKNKEIHSQDSILLTSYQANNYLRFDYIQSEITEYMEKRLDENLALITLDPTKQKLCLNYQQAYDLSFGKANSRQFFGDDELYKQQVNHFNNYGIDISEKVDIVSFDKIENTPLALFLMNGNQAIYMNDTLFLVGKDYFAAYKQPTDEQLIFSNY